MQDGGENHSPLSYIHMRKLTLFFILFSSISFHAFGTNKEGGKKMITPSEKPEVLAFYDNRSAFHQDGSAYWLGVNGKVIAYRYVRTSDGSIVVEIYDLQLEASELEEIVKKVGLITSKDVSINDRQGIPDEVRVHYGFMKPNNEFVKFDLWEGDRGKQPKSTQEVIDTILKIEKIIFGKEPTKTRTISRGSPLNIAPWPDEFKPIN